MPSFVFSIETVILTLSSGFPPMPSTALTTATISFRVFTPYSADTPSLNAS
jgi:hypothetical protein